MPQLLKMGDERFGLQVLKKISSVPTVVIKEIFLDLGNKKINTNIYGVRAFYKTLPNSFDKIAMKRVEELMMHRYTTMSRGVEINLNLDRLDLINYLTYRPDVTSELAASLESIN